MHLVCNFEVSTFISINQIIWIKIDWYHNSNANVFILLGLEYSFKSEIFRFFQLFLRMKGKGG